MSDEKRIDIDTITNAQIDDLMCVAMRNGRGKIVEVCRVAMNLDLDGTPVQDAARAMCVRWMNGMLRDEAVALAAQRVLASDIPSDAPGGLSDEARASLGELAEAPKTTCSWLSPEQLHAEMKRLGVTIEPNLRPVDLADLAAAIRERDEARTERDEALLALKLRDDEVAWFEIELERAQHGRRVKERDTEAARAYLAANKSVTSINVNAYTLALDQIEALIPERDEARAEVARLTVKLEKMANLAREGFSQGWDGIDSRDKNAEIDLILVRNATP